MTNPFEILNSRLSNIENMLLDLKHNPKKQAQDSDDIQFDLPGLCDYLASKPARATVYTWVSNRSIPHKKVGKRLIFLKSQIDIWIKSKGRMTNDEIEAEAIQNINSTKNNKK